MIKMIIDIDKLTDDELNQLASVYSDLSMTFKDKFQWYTDKLKMQNKNEVLSPLAEDFRKMLIKNGLSKDLYLIKRDEK